MAEPGTNEFDLLGRILASLVLFFLVLIGAYIALAVWGPRTPTGAALLEIGWIADLVKGIVGAFVGLIGGFGLAKRS